MDFDDIETQIIKTLKDDLDCFKRVETYEGNFDRENLKRMAVNFPAAFVLLSSINIDSVDGPNHKLDCGFTVLVAAKDLRGKEQTKTGAHGCYQLIKDVLEKLTNQKFGLEMEPLKPGKVSLFFTDQYAVIYGIEFNTNFDKTFSWP